ncbi:MAG: hypothetical protein WCI60_00675, partial [bacterium]
VIEIRNISNTLKLNKPSLTMTKLSEVDQEEIDLIKKLANLSDIKEVKTGKGIKLTSSEMAAWIDVDKSVIDQYLDEVKDKVKQRETQAENLRARLSNKSYIEKAPKKLIEDTKKNLKEIEEEIAALKEEATRF